MYSCAFIAQPKNLRRKKTMSRKKCPRCNLVNFADEQNCRRCSTDLFSNNSPAVNSARVSRSHFPLLLKLFILAVVGGICYFGYLTYNVESENVSRQQKQIQADKERIHGAYVESIRNELRKSASPTPSVIP